MSTGHQAHTQLHLHLHVLTKHSDDVDLPLEPPPSEGAKLQLRIQQGRASADWVGTKCSRGRSTAHQGMLSGKEMREGKSHTGSGWKIPAEEPQRVIKRSQATNFPGEQGRRHWEGQMRAQPESWELDCENQLGSYGRSGGSREIQPRTKNC